MAGVKPIRTEADLRAALARIDEIVDAEPGAPEFDELDALSDQVAAYEDAHCPIPRPSLVDAVEFRMEQAGLTPQDLAPYIGSPAEVEEILSGKRALTPSMARALRDWLGIPGDALLRGEPDAATRKRRAAARASKAPVQA